MLNIVKKFPGTVANDNVNFHLKRGEIHALLGENGAGKTTLMNVLYGLYGSDNEKSKIIINGKEVSIKEPIDAMNNGIGMVHQHFM
ncbi:MAG: ATP-binding cassette domain-containing protein, partial [Candidatus Hodarchaeales archaeon]